MSATINYIPAPKSIELHLGTSPDFSKYSKKVKALGGRYSECRGNAYKRFVDLPWNEEGRKLANRLVAEFGLGNRTTLIVRGVDTFRKKHVHAWVVVHKVDQQHADPCGSLLAKYEEAFLRAFPDATEPEPVVEVESVDEDSLPVSLTITKAQARVVLAALERRVKELDSLGGPEADALSAETRVAYQHIDGQVFSEF